MDFELPPFPRELPVFPLPQVVLFPRAVAPLHIFEPRYRAMTAHALAHDHLLALALLRPGYEPDYYSRKAPIHPVVGIDRIVAAEQLADGKYNLLVAGAARGRIIEEVDGHPFRMAQCALLETRWDGIGEANAMREELRTLLRDARFATPELRQQWNELVDMPLKLGEVADLIASSLPVDPELRQLLLDEPEESRRARLLIEHLSTVESVQRRRRQVGDASFGEN